jgi:hypothetical protein
MKTNPIMEKVRQTTEYRDAVADRELAKEYGENVGFSKVDKSCASVDFLAGLRKGRELEAENSPFLPQIIETFGWKVGTLHQVLDEVKRLKKNEKEALDLHCETLILAEANVDLRSALGDIEGEMTV